MTANQANATQDVSPKIAGYALSYAITAIFSALLVVLKESNETVLEFMKALTGHHWITHGLLDIAVFIVLGIVLSRASSVSMSGNALISTVVGATVVAGLIIAGFFGL